MTKIRPVASRATARRVTTAILLAAVGAAALSGCSAGHGEYTEDFRQQANTRMDQVRAGTEWEMAHSQFLAGDLKKALKSINKALAMTETVPRVHTLHGRILFEMGELDQALESFARAIELDPTYSEAHYFTGIVYERLMKPELALEAYRAAAEHDPNNAQFAIASAEMLIQLERLDDAWELLSNDERTFQHSAGVRQLQGHIALMRGDEAKAIKLFEEACLLAPDEPSLVEDLARVQIEVGDYAEAEYSISRLIRMDTTGTRRDLLHLQARCLMEMDQPVEAREIYKQLTMDERGTTDYSAWFGLAKASIILKEDLRLREAANRMIRISPERHEGYLMLAMFQRSKGQLESAAELLDKAIDRTDSDPQPAMLQAMIYHDLGRFTDALESAEIAAELDPTSVHARTLVSAMSTEVRDHAIADVPVGID
ncbi:MAG: tetratricopeptide repeat protein [Phycisphaerales bacterium JB065]